MEESASVHSNESSGSEDRDANVPPSTSSDLSEDAHEGGVDASEMSGFVAHDALDMDDDAQSQYSMSSEIRLKQQEVSDQEKRLLIGRVERMCSAASIQPPFMDTSWTLEDITDELHKVQNELSLRRSIKFQRRLLLTFCTGIEYVHNKTPAAGALDGWGENLMASIDDFDSVFERLHEKHGPKIGGAAGPAMEPEAELLYLLGYNAFTFCLTNNIARLATQPAKDTARERLRASSSDTKAFTKATKVKTPGQAPRVIELG